MLVEICVPAECDGLRVDVFLANFCDEIATRSAAQKLLGEGKVGVAHPLFEKSGVKTLTKNHKVKAGEVIFCEIPAPVPSEAKAEDIPLDIIYEDTDLIVINKPRGLVVHPAAGHYTGTLVNALLFHCESSGLSGIGGITRPGIVHRLDKDTSGLMVAAKNDAAHRGLAAQLASRKMGRTYNAICIGKVKRDAFQIDLPIGRHPKDRKKMAVFSPQDLFNRENARSRNAVTNITVLERFNAHTLIAARLETGRTHQIRVHMAHIGYPVLGDTIYGIPKQNFDGQVLHATNLRFSHPSTGKDMEFSSPLPSYFINALKKVGGLYV